MPEKRYNVVITFRVDGVLAKNRPVALQQILAQLYRGFGNELTVLAVGGGVPMPTDGRDHSE